jgi:hypothetical protein
MKLSETTIVPLPPRLHEALALMWCRAHGDIAVRRSDPRFQRLSNEFFALLNEKTP